MAASTLATLETLTVQQFVRSRTQRQMTVAAARRNVFAALAMKFRNAAYPLKGVEQHPSTKKRGASWKSSKSKKSKQATRNAQNEMADGAAKAVEGPLFLSEKSFKSNKEDRAEPQFNSDKKAYHEDRVKEEPFKSINKANQQANTVDYFIGSFFPLPFVPQEIGWTCRLNGSHKNERQSMNEKWKAVVERVEILAKRVPTKNVILIS
ncbi:hypothetical protein Tcan_08160 [Toxocara canis]|uniref:Uncharacterized protein n=1 Tax=Toxocara canis TaxID=6265 RepID=A0A0B2VLG3_TOXCA|nr:hypothetical protein Tcan_08160 [Toxocara canis]